MLKLQVDPAEVHDVAQRVIVITDHIAGCIALRASGDGHLPKCAAFAQRTCAWLLPSERRLLSMIAPSGALERDRIVLGNLHTKCRFQGFAYLPIATGLHAGSEDLSSRATLLSSGIDLDELLTS